MRDSKIALGQSTLVGDSAASAVWTLASRLTGFARVILIGAVLGPTYFGNLFQLANQLPLIVLELAVGALLHALLVPAVMAAIADGDRERTERIAGGFLGLVLTGFLFITALVMAGSYLIAQAFAVPLGDAAVRADFVRAAVPLILLTAPQLIGYGVAITGQALQQAMGRFALPAAAGISENLIVIATLGLFASRFGTGLALSEIDGGHLLFLGAGATLGVFVHAAVQLWGVRRSGIRLRPRAGWSDREITDIIRKLAPSSGTAALNSARLLLLMVAANVVPGGVVALQLALNALNLPVALGAKPVAYASLPRLSLLHQRGDGLAFRRGYHRGVVLAALILLPAAAASLALGRFAAGGVAIGQMATDDGRRLIGLALVGIGGAIVGEGMFQLSTAAAYAMDDAVAPLRALVVRFGVTAVGLVIGAALFDDALLLLVFAASMSFGDLAGALVLHRRVLGRLPADIDLPTRLLAVPAVAAAGCFLIAAAGAELLGRNLVPQSPLPVLAATAALALAGTAAYGMVSWRFGDSELPSLLAERRSQPEVADSGAVS